MKKFFFITLLLITICGCTRTNTPQVETIMEDGIVITNFTSNYNNLRINEATNIQALIYNNGDFNARNITSILYGEGLLSKEGEMSFTKELLPKTQEVHFWVLKVPTSLSQTESTSYQISNRVYYLYNYSTTQQVGFVQENYAGTELPLSTINTKSPLSTIISTRNPIRTLFDETVFTLTIIINNKGKGEIDYVNCTIFQNPPCNKNGYLNELRLTIPNNWGEVTDMTSWTKEETENTITYIINFNELETNFNEKCTSQESSAYCTKLNQAINNLRMVRGDEARIVLQFNKERITEPLIETVTVEGDFGYRFDASDHTSKINLKIQGD